MFTPFRCKKLKWDDDNDEKDEINKNVCYENCGMKCIATSWVYFWITTETETNYINSTIFKYFTFAL